MVELGEKRDEYKEYQKDGIDDIKMLGVVK